jgi:hypothetical protein
MESQGGGNGFRLDALGNSYRMAAAVGVLPMGACF